MLDRIKPKAKRAFAALLAAATAASAQTNDVVAAVQTASTEMQGNFGAIIGSVSPVVFIVVGALVCIGCAIKLFKKGG